jgi:hypothetical protein
LAAPHEQVELQCRFHSDIKGAESCHAHASVVVCDKGYLINGQRVLDPATDARSTLRVHCDDSAVYDDTADVQIGADAVLIQASNAQGIGLKLPAGVLSDDRPHVSTAWLYLGDEGVSHGYCHISQGHENDHP